MCTSQLTITMQNGANNDCTVSKYGDTSVWSKIAVESMSYKIVLFIHSESESDGPKFVSGANVVSGDYRST